MSLGYTLCKSWHCCWAEHRFHSSTEGRRLHWCSRIQTGSFPLEHTAHRPSIACCHLDWRMCPLCKRCTSMYWLKTKRCLKRMPCIDLVSRLRTMKYCPLDTGHMLDSCCIQRRGRTSTGGMVDSSRCMQKRCQKCNSHTGYMQWLQAWGCMSLRRIACKQCIRFQAYRYYSDTAHTSQRM